jgi:hypothetical protein
MCEVRRTVARVVLMGLAAGLLATTVTGAKAQVSTQAQIKRRQEAHARRETNATRQARIQRTINETYAHRWEAVGGGGFFRWNSGQYTKKNNEVGWDVNVNRYLNSRLAIVADARGDFGKAHALINSPFSAGEAARPSINEYFFMGGANYRFYRREKVAVSAFGLGGTSWGIFSSGAKGFNSNQTGLWNDGFAPAFSLGVALDYNIYPNIALRVAPAYTGTMFRPSNPNSPNPGVETNNFGRTLQNNAGFNVGIVYRFGKQ